MQSFTVKTKSRTNAKYTFLTLFFLVVCIVFVAVIFMASPDTEDIWIIYLLESCFVLFLIFWFFEIYIKALSLMIDVRGEHISIRSFPKHTASLKVSDIERYKLILSRHKKWKECSNKCLKIYYCGRSVEFFNEDVENFDLLVDYLEKYEAIEKKIVTQ